MRSADRARVRRAGYGVVGLMALAGSTAVAAGPIHRIERLLPDAVGGHCELAGERRPALACAKPELIALHKGRRVPASGLLRIRHETPTNRSGDFLVYTEVYTYDALPDAHALHLVLKRFQGLSADAAHGESIPLLPALTSDPALRPIAQAPTLVSGTMPAMLTIRLPESEVGRRALFLARAWPLGRQEVTLPALDAEPISRLLIGFGVQDGGAQPGASPTTFRLVAEASAASPATTLWERTLDPGRVAADRGWHDASIEIGAHRGRRLRLVATGTLGSDGQCLGTWAQPRVVVPHAGPARPNVLLLSLDTLRADHVGAYGWHRPTTPNLDRLATRGVVFEHALAPFPSTTASHMTMLTSVDPCGHRVTVPTVRLSPAIVTLSEVLAHEGYATLAITEDGLIKGEAGFERGFDSYRDQRPATRPLGVFTDGIELASTWLGERDPTVPFFLFLHTYQIHVPYKVPPHLRGLYPVTATASEAERQEAEYDRGLTYADELVGELVRRLEALDLFRDTLVIVTADHGTEFGEHGGIGHARGVHVEQVHVPLIVLDPTAPEGGRRVPALVGLVDLAPTALAAVGAPRPSSFQGRSLLPLLRGESLPSRPLHAEQLWGARETLRRGARYRWITTKAGTAVYDGAADPAERRDLAATHPKLAARGAAAIAAYRRQCDALHRRLSSAASAKPGPLGPEREHALRALGYIE